MVSIKIVLVGFFFTLIFIFVDQIYNPVGNILLLAIIIAASLVMSYMAYGELHIGCHCKRQGCESCREDRKYQRIYFAYLASLFLAFLSLRYTFYVMAILASLVCIVSFLHLVGETGKGEGISIEGEIFDQTRESYRNDPKKEDKPADSDKIE